jgi:dehydrogenase/reductase SDR family protein 12
MIFTSGATVYLVCRNKERGEAALSQIQTKTGNQSVHLEVFPFPFFPVM